MCEPKSAVTCPSEHTAAESHCYGAEDGVQYGEQLRGVSHRWARHNGADYVFYAPHPLTGASTHRGVGCDDLGR